MEFQAAFRPGRLNISADGKVLWKEPDHEVKIEDMRKELDRLVKK